MELYRAGVVVTSDLGVSCMPTTPSMHHLNTTLYTLKHFPQLIKSINVKESHKMKGDVAKSPCPCQPAARCILSYTAGSPALAWSWSDSAADPGPGENSAAGSTPKQILQEQ